MASIFVLRRGISKFHFASVAKGQSTLEFSKLDHVVVLWWPTNSMPKGTLASPHCLHLKTCVHWHLDFLSESHHLKIMLSIKFRQFQA